MSRSIPINLQFLASQNNKVMIETKVLESAAEVINLCQVRVSQVDDEKTKSELMKLIRTTGEVVHTLAHSKGKPNVAQKLLNLQLDSLQLPEVFLEKSKLSKLSYYIAMACVFILALSISISFGYVFHALVYNYFKGKVFFDILMQGLSVIGVPASSLGLFSYALSIFTDNSQEDMTDGKGMFAQLQTEINTFCELAQAQASSLDEALNAKLDANESSQLLTSA